jgi:uncharacterized protein with FMN-binding domain
VDVDAANAWRSFSHPKSSGCQNVDVSRTLHPLALGVAGIGLLGALAACSTPADGPAESEGAPANADTSAEYTDGTYEATGGYTAPSGPEQVVVEITLEDDIVTAVTVTPQATDGNAKQFQTRFADGIAAEVVGKDIDTLDVSRVGGSSLTSGGFNDALEQIKAQALAS